MLVSDMTLMSIKTPIETLTSQNMKTQTAMHYDMECNKIQILPISANSQHFYAISKCIYISP